MTTTTLTPTTRKVTGPPFDTLAICVNTICEALDGIDVHSAHPSRADVTWQYYGHGQYDACTLVGRVGWTSAGAEF